MRSAPVFRTVTATLVLIASSAAGADTPAWLADDAAQAQLSAGEVVIRSELGAGRASAQAAVRIHATPETVWRLITNCQSVTAFVPGLERCARLQTSADGSWSIVEHNIRYSHLMPLIRSIVLSQYQPPQRVDFKGIGGNIKAQTGSWVLEPLADGQFTRVEYSISIEAGLLVPRSIIRYSLKKELPVMLAGLRSLAEHVPAP